MNPNTLYENLLSLMREDGSALKTAREKKGKEKISHRGDFFFLIGINWYHPPREGLPWE